MVMIGFLKSILVIVKILQDIKVLLERWEASRDAVVVLDAGAWIDASDVKRLLNVSDATIYRRRAEGAWVCRKVGGKWFYLKSSL